MTQNPLLVPSQRIHKRQAEDDDEEYRTEVIMAENTSCNISTLEIKEIEKSALDILKQFDKLLHSRKPNRVFDYPDELEKIIKEIKDRIDRHQKECPSQWNAQQPAFEGELLELIKKYQELLSKIPSEAFIG